MKVFAPVTTWSREHSNSQTNESWFVVERSEDDNAWYMYAGPMKMGPAREIANALNAQAARQKS
jgi:hypothetical protein